MSTLIASSIVTVGTKCAVAAIGGAAVHIGMFSRAKQRTNRPEVGLGGGRAGVPRVCIHAHTR